MRYVLGLLILSVVTPLRAHEVGDQVVVVAKKRSIEVERDAKTVGTLDRGAIVTITKVSEVSGRYMIESEDELTGWIYPNHVVSIDEAIRIFGEEIEKGYNSRYRIRGRLWLRKGESEKAIADFTEAIKAYPEDAEAYFHRAYAWEYGSNNRIVDMTKVIFLEPDLSRGFSARAMFWPLKDRELKVIDLTCAIRIDPKDAELYGRRGTQYQRLDKYKKAVADFTKQIELEPNIAKHYVDRAFVVSYVSEGYTSGHDRAIRDYNKAIALGEKTAYIFYRRGQQWLERRDVIPGGISTRKDIEDYEKAVADFSEAIRIAPNDVNYFEYRAEAYRKLGLNHKALEDYNKIIDLDDKHETFVKVDHNEFVSEVTRKLRGDVLLEQKKYNEALADYTIAINLAPKASGAFHARGQTLRRLGKFSNAILDLNTAIKLNPKNAKTYYERAVCLYNTNDLVRAFEDLNTSIRIDPDYEWPYIFRGLIWERRKEYDKAILECTKAIAKNPKSGAAFNNRAYYKKLTKDYENAIADYKMAIELGFSKANGYLTKLYMDRSSTRLKNGEYDKLIVECTEVLAQDPKHALAYAQRGACWYKKTDYDKAIADFQKALELNPKYMNTRRTLGYSWLYKKDYDKAIKEFDIALDVDAKDVSALINRGYGFSKIGKYEKALSDYSKARELSPKNSMLLNSLAFFLATCPDKRFRDGAQAVELATNACELSGWEIAANVDTLAAAYAETDQFEKAIKWQKKAIELADESNKKEYRETLNLYNSGKPYQLSTD